MRYGDVGVPQPGTIALHKDVIAQLGYVWIAKFGKPVSVAKLRVLNKQIRDGIETLLLLVTRKGDDLAVSSCSLLETRRDLPKTETSHIPSYYRGSGRARAGVWFRVDKIDDLTPLRLDDFVVASSNGSLREALHFSMAGAFFVRRRVGAAT